MKAIILVTTIFTMTLTLVIPGVLSLGIKDIPVNVQPGLDVRENLYDSNPITQEVNVGENNFSGIGVSIKNPNNANLKNLEVRVYEQAAMKRLIFLNGKNIPDGNFTKILFDPISNSKGKIYTVEFKAPQANLSEAQTDRSLGLYLTDNKTDWLGKLTIAGTPDPKQVSMVIFHRPASSLELIKDIYVSTAVRFFKDFWFAIFYMLVLTALAVSVMVKFSKAGKSY